jgi:hypothetical protein
MSGRLQGTVFFVKIKYTGYELAWKCVEIKKVKLWKTLNNNSVYIILIVN